MSIDDDGPAVIVSGMIAGTPRQGGATWAVLQYVLGLRALGVDVTFIEPVAGGLRSDQVEYCRSVMTRFGLEGRWAIIADDGTTAGLDGSEIEAVARRTDVLLNVAGMLTEAKILEHIPARVYLDLDPAFVQMWHTYEGRDMRLDGHTHFVSVADSIGAPGSPIPTCGRTWISTLPPVVLDEWTPCAHTSHDAFTTVAHWRGYGSIHHGGVHYGQKAHSMRPLIDLPRRVGARCVVALAIHPDERDDIEQLDAHGWELLDPLVVAGSPDDYRRFVRGSAAELGIAKSGYVLSRSGWFSDRSACYLACGRPVMAQDTGFGRRLPTGEGLFAFRDVDDAAAAVDEIRRDPIGQRCAALEIARAHLDARKVLKRLLSQVAP